MGEEVNEISVLASAFVTQFTHWAVTWRGGAGDLHSELSQVH